MSVRYQAIPAQEALCVKELCNDLMTFQKSKARIHPELFDDMCFETRMVPSIEGAKENHLIVVWDKDEIVGYVYSNIAAKETYSNAFATFFDLESVEGADVGCLSQFYLKEGYRNSGIGSVLFEKSLAWLKGFEYIDDLFIFVSNGNDDALAFYTHKGFTVSHDILDGFITVLRSKRI